MSGTKLCAGEYVIDLLLIYFYSILLETIIKLYFPNLISLQTLHKLKDSTVNFIFIKFFSLLAIYFPNCAILQIFYKNSLNFSQADIGSFGVKLS